MGHSYHVMSCVNGDEIRIRGDIWDAAQIQLTTYQTFEEKKLMDYDALRDWYCIDLEAFPDVYAPNEQGHVIAAINGIACIIQDDWFHGGLRSLFSIQRYSTFLTEEATKLAECEMEDDLLRYGYIREAQ